MAVLTLIWTLLLASKCIAFGGYRLVSVSRSHTSFVAVLDIVQNSIGDEAIESLNITISHETNNRLHLLITDAKKPRWEVPKHLIPRNTVHHEALSPNLQLSYTVNPFSFTVTRTSDGEVIFDSPTSSIFVFRDQYLEISTRIPKDASLYGLGESTRSSGLRLVPNSTYTLWTADIGASNTNVNLYGSQPFYLDVRKGGNTHGVLLLNSNGMDVVFTGELLTFKAIGGVFDFYFFAGPSPLSVVQQLVEVVGKPAPMPYWSLGFHQCRWGYKNVSQLETVVESYRRANIPLEAMWTDIDHMEAFKDFTLDPLNFPQDRMKAFVDKLHANDQRYVLIVDPGIRAENNYSTYQRAKAADIFIKDSQGKPYLGQVWPGPVHFPDFLHPKTSQFWAQEILKFHRTVDFDGLWIDMNEVSNFCTGITCSLPSTGTCPIPGDFTTCCLVCNSDNVSKWDEPLYAINNAGTHRILGGKTIPTSARHFNEILEYNAHNLYGFAEAKVTYQALRSVLKNKRPFVLSRSTFVGSGSVTAHWTGDNTATWDDLKYSIVGILNSGLAGIPMVGSDICGFSGDTTEELCNRWIQLGSFYPFTRNHNDIASKPQELYLWKSVTHSAQKSLGLRYKLLPYLYTLNFEAHSEGSPVARPMFLTFPQDPQTHGIDSQFLLGSRVMISPVLQSSVTSVNAYFPKGTWYNLFNYSKVTSSGSYHILEASWDTINVHVHEGSIIPMQDVAETTTLARKTPFTLLVTLSSGESSGELFLDDGERQKMQVEAGKSTFVKFKASRNGVSSSVVHGEFAAKQGFVLDKLTVLGAGLPRNLSINGKPASHVKVEALHTGVLISGLRLPLAEGFDVKFQ